jgi:hypothetical protein
VPVGQAELLTLAVEQITNGVKTPPCLTLRDVLTIAHDSETLPVALGPRASPSEMS